MQTVEQTTQSVKEAQLKTIIDGWKAQGSNVFPLSLSEFFAEPLGCQTPAFIRYIPIVLENAKRFVGASPHALLFIAFSVKTQ